MPHPIDYARVVQKIANEMDIMRVDLESGVTIGEHYGRHRDRVDHRRKRIERYRLGIDVRSVRTVVEVRRRQMKLFKFVEKNMGKDGAKLISSFGTDVAARVMGLAGGLELLSKMPSNVVQNIGTEKEENIAGSSLQVLQKSGDVNVGFIFQCDLIQKKTLPPLRVKAVRLIAGGVLMARVDAFAKIQLAKLEEMYEEIKQKIEKWQEPPLARQRNHCQPGMIQKKRRGGKRMRAMKERYGMSDMRKRQPSRF